MHTDIMWNRVQMDGTTLKCWQLVKSDSTTPSETDWSSATLVVNTTGALTSGGRIGFLHPSGGNPVEIGNLTIKSYNTATSAFDKTEATENFTVDGSGYANDTLASDSNGNQIYDGTQVYTYDGWNRLMTVSHGYRDGSGVLQHGQAAVTMAYDAKGRRISKAIANTGNWDCTYNYYYKGDQQIEQQNGSHTAIKQFVWGQRYIDELVQVSLNSAPNVHSGCDVPYYVCQDANFNVLGVVSGFGGPQSLIERYEYSPYGQRQVLYSAGINDPDCYTPTLASQRFTLASSAVAPYGICEFGHQGLMHDEESGLVYNRARCLSPVLERFLQRDPIGYVDGLSRYQFEKSNTLTGLDPSGFDRYVSGGVNDNRPDHHSQLTVDNWLKINGKWVKTGTSPYGLSITDGFCSSSADSGPASWLNDLGGILSCVGPGIALGTVDNESPRFALGPAISSTLEQDIALRDKLDREVGKRAYYHVMFNNCHEWVNRRKFSGISGK